VEVSAWVAVAAGVPGLLALALAAYTWRVQARLRAGQRVLLPDGSSASLLDRQAALQRAMTRVQEGLDDLENLVERRAETTEAALRGALRFQGMVRYDAYRDMGGKQSWSVALLDGTHSGSIITSLHARDHARVYLKEMVEGVPGQRLSPEELRAVTLALGREPGPPPAPTPRVPRTTDRPATAPAGEPAREAEPAGERDGSPGAPGHDAESTGEFPRPRGEDDAGGEPSR